MSSPYDPSNTLPTPDTTPMPVPAAETVGDAPTPSEPEVFSEPAPTENPTDNIQVWRSTNFSPKNVSADYIILGDAGTADTETTLRRFENALTRHRVCPHFYITRLGNIYRLVEMDKRAWHAGEDSRWKKHSNLNKNSLGILLAGSADGCYTDAQYHALMQLIRYLMQSVVLNQNPEIVLSHSDVRPWKHHGVSLQFDWQRLIQENLAAPFSVPENTDVDVLNLLRAFGYRGSQKMVVTAFQRRFLPHNVTGKLDDTTRTAILNTPPTPA